ncbi:MAG TPA: metallophosphoesterase [Kofleriaceae bacterium]
MHRHVVIGDIHGCLAELQALLAAVAVTPDDVVVSVGDVVDRGPESVEVVQFLRSRPNTIVLAGNHERKHIRRVFSYAQEITRAQFGAGYPEAVEWMRTLPYYVELEDAIVVHAALVPGIPLAEQRDEILCGSTVGEHELQRALGDHRWHELWQGPKPVIFGHHVVDEPLVRPSLVYGIDTGACHGGHLTALTLPDLQLHAVAAREDHWARIKRLWQADVLASKPWPEMTWAELDEQLAQFAASDEPRTRAYVAALGAWRAALEHRRAAVLDGILDTAARISATPDAEQAAAAMKAHPLAGFLFQARRGRLDAAAFARQCQTPARLAEFSRGLDLSSLPPPALPARHG